MANAPHLILAAREKVTAILTANANLVFYVNKEMVIWTIQNLSKGLQMTLLMLPLVEALVEIMTTVTTQMPIQKSLRRTAFVELMNALLTTIHQVYRDRFARTVKLMNGGDGQIKLKQGSGRNTPVQSTGSRAILETGVFGIRANFVPPFRHRPSLSTMRS